MTISLTLQRFNVAAMHSFRIAPRHLKTETVVRLLNPLKYAPLLPWQPVQSVASRFEISASPLGH